MFKDIVGQEDAKNLLINAINKQNISHAYILSGEKGSGKRLLADAFAQMLMCENKDEKDACGECHACKQTKNRNNPDVIYVRGAKKKDTKDEDDIREPLKVDDIREKINNDIVIKPYSSQYKIYIVENAETMNQQAQNALLKTIEEPPAYGIIILLTTNHNAFLQTILSRCITIQMRPISDDLIRQVLRNKYEVVDYRSELLSSFAQGNLGRAIDLISNEHFNDIKQEVLSLAKKAAYIDEAEVQETVATLATFKGEINEILDLIALWYRDVLLYKATFDETHIIFKEDMYDIKKQASDCSYSGLDAIFTALREAQERLSSNVNLDLLLELLILKIKENSR